MVSTDLSLLLLGKKEWSLTIDLLDWMRGIQYSLDIDKYRSFQTEKISLSLIEIFFVSSVYNFSFS